MSTSALRGGLAALERLGSIDSSGSVHRVPGARAWSTADNGNPDNMLEFVRDVLGEHDTVMFTIERDLNRNVMIYRPNFEGDAAPARPGWLMVPADADLDNTTIDMVDNQLKEEDITGIEQLGYGVKSSGPSSFSIRALPDTVVHMFETDDQQWRVRVEVDGTLRVLQRIVLFVTTRFGLPGVREVHVEVEDDAGAVSQHFYAVK